MKWWIGKNFIWFCWKLNLQEVLFNYAYVIDLVFLQVGAEFGSGSVVWFNRPNFAHSFGQSDRNNARSGADIKY